MNRHTQRQVLSMVELETEIDVVMTIYQKVGD
jgi:hypothetical protein